MAKPEHIDGRIKMVVNTKHGYPNRSWGSFKALDEKTDDYIIDGMINRLRKQPIYNVIQVVQFFCTKTGSLLREYKDEKHSTKAG